MISIIIPLYNKATSIKRTIHSVLSQSYTDFELIIINDGSTDNSAEIVNKQFYDKRIRYIYQDNAGVSSARNRGIKEAIGEWILFLDADDILYPNALKILISKSEHSELQSGIPDMKGLRKLFCYIYEYYSIIYSDGLLNASKYLQNIYRRRSKKVFKEKIPMLYYPYAFNTNVVKVIEKENIKDKFKKYLSQPTLVFLGTVTRNYGVFTIIDAVKQLKDQTRPFNVLILGKGRHYQDAKTYVSENYLSDIIEMPGFVDEEDISQYFSVASAFISPMNDTIQDWARCPSKMYLYLPYKKPIITCKIGEPYEILQDKGFYYASGNAKDMATQMKKIIENNKYTADAHAEKHSWNVRAQELDNWIKLTWK